MTLYFPRWFSITACRFRENAGVSLLSEIRRLCYQCPLTATTYRTPTIFVTTSRPYIGGLRGSWNCVFSPKPGNRFVRRTCVRAGEAKLCECVSESASLSLVLSTRSSPAFLLLLLLLLFLLYGFFMVLDGLRMGFEWFAIIWKLRFSCSLHGFYENYAFWVVFTVVCMGFKEFIIFVLICAWVLREPF